MYKMRISFFKYFILLLFATPEIRADCSNHNHKYVVAVVNKDTAKTEAVGTLLSTKRILTSVASLTPPSDKYEIESILPTRKPGKERCLWDFFSNIFNSIFFGKRQTMKGILPIELKENSVWGSGPDFIVKLPVPRHQQRSLSIPPEWPNWPFGTRNVGDAPCEKATVLSLDESTKTLQCSSVDLIGGRKCKDLYNITNPKHYCSLTNGSTQAYLPGSPLMCGNVQIGMLDVVPSGGATERKLLEFTDVESNFDYIAEVMAEDAKADSTNSSTQSPSSTTAASTTSTSGGVRLQFYTNIIFILMITILL